MAVQFKPITNPGLKARANAQAAAMRIDPWEEAGNALVDLPPTPKNKKANIIPARREKQFKVGKRLGTKKEYLKKAQAWYKKHKSTAGFTAEHGYWHGEDLKGNKAIFGISANKNGKVGVLKKTGDGGTGSSYIKRRDALIKQKSEWIPTYDWGSAEQGMEGHHRRFRELYEPFYEGYDINSPEARELTEFFVESHTPLGDAKSNLEDIYKDIHRQGPESLHSRAIAEQIQVTPGKPGESNFSYDSEGNVLRVKGGAVPQDQIIFDKQGKYKGLKSPTKEAFGSSRFPNFKNADMNNRKAAAIVFMNNVQPRVDEITAEAVHTQEVRDFGSKARSKQQILSDFAARDAEAAKAQIRNQASWADVANRSRIGWRTGGLIKTATGFSRAESLMRLGGGDVVGGTLGLLMTTNKFQTQVGKLLLKQGIKLVPGVSLGSGALQAAGYMMGGQWTKAGLSMLGGAVGELGPAGDAVQAAIDLGLTGHDLKMDKINKARLWDEDDTAYALRRASRTLR